MRLAFLLAALPALPALAEPCRVLINVDDGVGHQVADVTLSDPPRVRVVPGLALGSGASVTQLRLVRDGQWSKGLDVRFDTLVAGEGKTEKIWLGGRQEMEKPMPGEQAMPWYADFRLDVVSIVGPRISVHGSGYGFTGGAHDFDSRTPRTLLAPQGTPVDVAAWLGAPYIEAARASIEAERKTREDGWEGGPQATSEALKDAIVIPQPMGITVETSIDCCSWAENHNYHDLTVKLPPPADLKGLLPDADGWFDTGTCAVRVVDGQVHSRQGPVAHLPGRVVGVAWIDAAAPALKVRPVDEVARKAAFARARAVTGQAEDLTVVALLHKALDADPQNAETLGEIGYLHLKSKSYALAEAFTLRALEGAEAADLDGRLRYTLGRIAEGRGEWARARRLFKSSLVRRPHPVVKKALADLEAKLK